MYQLPEELVSFIRSTSNPEGLYIWHDVGKYIAVTSSALVAEGQMLRLSTRDWYALLREAHNNPWKDRIKRGSLTVCDDVPGKVRLETPQGNVIMYDTTWRYIVGNYGARS